MLKILTKRDTFPDPHYASKDGLLAIGGDLSVKRLIDAYENGIFPWYSEGEPILWWSPEPRCVIFIDELKVSRRLKRAIKNTKITVTFNKAFKDVINLCARVHTVKHSATWITKDMIDAYINLFNARYCISAESWLEDKLVGGLYGVYINKVFSGESMFSIMDDAAKIAFVKLAEYLKTLGCKVIDCQLPSEHMMRFGAKLIPRRMFIELLKNG